MKSIFKTSKEPHEIPVFKVVVIGDARAGKTSLIHRIVFDKFLGSNYPRTIGMDFLVKKSKQNGFKFQIWDFALCERSERMVSKLLSCAQALVFCFDATCADSFQNLKPHFLRKTKSDEQCLLFLVATKCDLATNR